MTKIEPDDQEEKPLDPAMESVRRKMVRLQIVSGAIMFVSLMAVFGAVVYKTMRAPAGEPAAVLTSSGVPSGAPVSATAALPSGFVIQSTSLSGDQIMFFGATADGVMKALVFDIKVGHIVADITVNGG
jgi:putative copper export protein